MESKTKTKRISPWSRRQIKNHSWKIRTLQNKKIKVIMKTKIATPMKMITLSTCLLIKMMEIKVIVNKLKKYINNRKKFPFILVHNWILIYFIILLHLKLYHSFFLFFFILIWTLWTSNYLFFIGITFNTKNLTTIILKREEHQEVWDT